jgi:hypothetical protein
MTTREITPRATASRLGVRLDGVYGLLWAGKLRGRKVDGRWLILEADVQKRAQLRPRRSKSDE